MPQTYSDGMARRPRFYEVEVRSAYTGLPVWGLVFALSAETAACQLAMDKGYGAVWDVNEGWWARRSDNEWFGNLPIPESEDYEVWSTEETYRRVEAPTPALAAGLILAAGAQLHRRLWTAFRIRDGARFSPAGGGGAEMQNDQPLPYTDYQEQKQKYRVELAEGAYYIWAHGAATAAEFAAPAPFDASNDDWRAVRLHDGRLFGNGAAPRWRAVRASDRRVFGNGAAPLEQEAASSDEALSELYEVHGETEPGGALRWALVRAETPKEAATEALGTARGWWWARTSTKWFGMKPSEDEDYIVQTPLMRTPKVIEASSPAFAAKTALHISMRELPRRSWNALRVRDGRLFGTDPKTTVEPFCYERPYTDEAPALGASREYIVHFGGDELVQRNGPNAEDAAYKAAAMRDPTWDPWSEFWVAERISDGRRFGHGWEKRSLERDVAHSDVHLYEVWLSEDLWALEWSVSAESAAHQAAMRKGLGPDWQPRSGWLARRMPDDGWFGDHVPEAEDYEVRLWHNAPRRVEAPSPGLAVQALFPVGARIDQHIWTAVRIRDGKPYSVYGPDGATRASEPVSVGSVPYTDYRLRSKQEYEIDLGGPTRRYVSARHALEAAELAAPSSGLFDPAKDYWRAVRASDRRVFGYNPQQQKGFDAPDAEEGPGEVARLRPVTASSELLCDEIPRKRYDVELYVDTGDTVRATMRSAAAHIAAIETALWCGIEDFDIKQHAWTATDDDGNRWGTERE